MTNKECYREQNWEQRSLEYNQKPEIFLEVKTIPEFLPI